MAVRQPVSFAALLKRYRTEAGFTQEELAERATLSVRAISDLERGVNRAPHRATVDLLAAALALTPDEQAEFERSIPRQRGAYRASGDEGTSDSFTLPDTPTPLVGRERDVADILHRLRWGGVRLLTLTGPGGVGKTRVAIAVARALQHDATHGVLYLPLAQLRDARLVAVSLARALDQKEESGRSLEDSVMAALHPRDMFLVLDNFEHVVEASRLLARVLRECPDIKLIVTSRTVLRIAGEQRFELAPLEVPGGEKLSVAIIDARYPAVELFAQRARAVKRDFELTETNLASVVEICSRLDGLPLAIELAAARIGVLTPQSLLMRLDRRLRILTDGARDVPDRHQTMADTIGWSYQLLDSRAQALFRRLAIFDGGCSLEAVESGSGVAGAGAPDLLRALSMLVDSSMLQVREGSDGHSRYTMLETVREYGLERLEAAGEQEDAWEAHTAYFVQLAERASGQLTGNKAGEWSARLREEEDNLRAALRRLAELGRASDGVRLAGALWRFWYMLGTFTEGRYWLSQFLDLKGANEVAPDVLARAHFGLGAMAYSLSDSATARHAYEQSLALWRASDSREGIATALNGLGVLAIQVGEYGRAQNLLEECVELRRQLPDQFGLAAALSNLANTTKYQGDILLATRLYRESLALYETIGSSVGADVSLDNLAQVMVLTGDYEGARRCSEQSLALAREGGRQFMVAQSLTNLGNLALELGDLRTAEEHYAEALGLYTRMGDRSSAALVLANQAHLSRAQGNYRRAHELGIESLKVQRELGDERNMASALLYLGDIALEQHRHAEAAAHYREALRLNAHVGYLLGIAEGLEHVGWLRAAQEAEDAAVVLGSAHALRASMGVVLTPSEVVYHDRALATLRAVLSESAYDQAWTRGQSLEWQAAAALVHRETV